MFKIDEFTRNNENLNFFHYRKFIDLYRLSSLQEIARLNCNPARFPASRQIQNLPAILKFKPPDLAGKTTKMASLVMNPTELPTAVISVTNGTKKK